MDKELFTTGTGDITNGNDYQAEISISYNDKYPEYKNISICFFPHGNSGSITIKLPDVTSESINRLICKMQDIKAVLYAEELKNKK